jgi:hypothetical protein
MGSVKGSLQLLLILLLCALAGPACAEAVPLVYQDRVMDQITLEDPVYAEIDIGEIQPEDAGAEPTFGIIIPRRAVILWEGQPYALVKTEPGLTHRGLELGVGNAQVAEVIEGVLPGDQVLVSETDRAFSKYWEMKELWDDPERNPEVVQEIALLYRRFFLYTAVTLIITIPLILWLLNRPRGNISKS